MPAEYVWLNIKKMWEMATGYCTTLIARKYKALNYYEFYDDSMTYHFHYKHHYFCTIKND